MITKELVTGLMAALDLGIIKPDTEVTTADGHPITDLTIEDDRDAHPILHHTYVRLAVKP